MPLTLVYRIQPRRISQGVILHVHLSVLDTETFLTENGIRKLNLIFCHQSPDMKLNHETNVLL